MIDIAKDVNDIAYNWVIENLKIRKVKNDFTAVFRKDKKPIGAIIFTLGSKFNCYLSIYTESTEWANRTIFKWIIDKCFKDFKVKKITCSIERENKRTREFMKKFGFKMEGVIRFGRQNGRDDVIYGLTKKDLSKCKFYDSEVNKNE